MLRTAIKERIESATIEDIVFDLGFGWVPDEAGTGLILGYTVVFKAPPPVPLLGHAGGPLAHTCTLVGHTPDDDQVDHAVDAALGVLRDKAVRQMTPPPNWPRGLKYPA